MSVDRVQRGFWRAPVALLILVLMLVPSLWPAGSAGVAISGATASLSVHDSGHAARPAELDRIVVRSAAQQPVPDDARDGAGLVPAGPVVRLAWFAPVVSDNFDVPAETGFRPSRRQAPRAPPGAASVS